jgi:hypothetical protein
VEIKDMGRPELALPHRHNSDEPMSLPLAPRNFFVTSPYVKGVIDLRWDNPSLYAENNSINILGINVYRSYNNPSGPYIKLNDTPLGGLYYRDQTKEVLIDKEDCMGQLLPGRSPDANWVVRTLNKPIVVSGTNGKISDNPKDIMVDIDNGDGAGFLRIPAWRLFGQNGEIHLINKPIYNSKTNRIEDPRLPIPPFGGIRVTYSYLDQLIATDIGRKIYYKATTQAINTDTGAVIETPLSEVEAKSLEDMEETDYIWKEAIRRNRWILEQQGERVKVFIRRWFGTRCSCWDDQYKRSQGDCHLCFGTGYSEGYDGPYDIIIAPPEAEKSIELLDMGLHISYEWQSWTGPFPLLTDRDFIVRQNGDRFSVAKINPQGSRGAVYQQHFNMAYLTTTDIRYYVPITGGQSLPPQAWNAFRTKAAPSEASPTIPQKPTIPEQFLKKGRTVTFENIMY